MKGDEIAIMPSKGYDPSRVNALLCLLLVG